MNASWHVIAAHGDWRTSAPWEATYDKYFERAATADVSVLPVLYGRKTAAAHQQFYLNTEPTTWTEWHEFVWTFVQRYGRNGHFWQQHPGLNYKPVTVWEVWNEPNLAVNNPGETVLPQKYAEFLIASSNTIHSAQAAIRAPSEPIDVRVLHGGIYQPGGMAVWTFLEKASKIPGFAASFHGLSLHPYSFNGAVGEKLAGVAVNLDNARNALNAFVGVTMPIYITELGWPVAGSGQPLVPESEQAGLLTSIFNWLTSKAGQYNLQLVTWYFAQDLAVPTWDYHTGLRRTDGTYRPSWWAFRLQAGMPGKPAPSVDELGYVRLNHSTGYAHLDSYMGAPGYQALVSSSDTGYPAFLGDPDDRAVIAIDSNGDGIDELGYVALNTYWGMSHLDTYTAPPNYKTLASNSDTAYPSINDPENVTAVPLDIDGDHIDELAYVRLKNNPTNRAHIDLYAGAPSYQRGVASCATAYPEVSDPENVRVLALDWNGDGVDELGFVRLNGPSLTFAHLDGYVNGPCYTTLASSSPTGYPAFTGDPDAREVIAIDWNGDGSDELGYVALNTYWGMSHLDTYTGAPSYKALASSSDTAYPSITDPENVTAVGINWSATP